LGTAPEAWEHLEAPDAIFIGGTGRTVGRIVDAAYDRLRPGGRIVTNVASIQNLERVHSVLQAKAGQAQVLMINMARGTDQLERLRFESLNPTFLITAVRE
jgi:precorrin-6Y C5,15-methyltransferase (decarboxylating)